jgi:23S rRNA (adenine2503-C2)-methyltransferase
LKKSQMPINDAPLSAGSSLCGIPLDELTELLNPLPRYRAAQIFKWIARGVIDFAQMTDIPDSLREHLQKHYCLCSGKIESRQNDRDSMKLVLAFPDNVRIESVLLSDSKKRLTACLSTQAGCPIGCVFCKTGNIKFKRNLSSSEIVEQLLYLRAAAAEMENSAIDNIVIMGMGEPDWRCPQAALRFPQRAFLTKLNVWQTVS